MGNPKLKGKGSRDFLKAGTRSFNVGASVESGCGQTAASWRPGVKQRKRQTRRESWQAHVHSECQQLAQILSLRNTPGFKAT